QAEDGIRDGHVTGVQTCALPICYRVRPCRRELVTLRSMMNQARKERKLRLADIPHFPMPQDSKPRTGFVNPDVFNQLRAAMPKRSEERRVGKKCRARVGSGH